MYLDRVVIVVSKKPVHFAGSYLCQGYRHRNYRVIVPYPVPFFTIYYYSYFLFYFLPIIFVFVIRSIR